MEEETSHRPDIGIGDFTGRHRLPPFGPAHEDIGIGWRSASAARPRWAETELDDFRHGHQTVLIICGWAKVPATHRGPSSWKLTWAETLHNVSPEEVKQAIPNQYFHDSAVTYTWNFFGISPPKDGEGGQQH